MCVNYMCGCGLDTLGTMARTMGVSNFRPIAEECVQLGMVWMSEQRVNFCSLFFSLL